MEATVNGVFGASLQISSPDLDFGSLHGQAMRAILMHGALPVAVTLAAADGV